MSRSRVRSFPIVGALTLAAVALGHELIYVIANGTGEAYATAMREGGHDRYWTSFLLIVATVTGLLVTITGLQFRRLRRLAADVEAGTVRVDEAGFAVYAAKVWTTWRRLVLWTVLTYFVQENIETVGVAASAPGIDVLVRDQGIALPVLLAVSLLVAAVGALAAWRRQVLLARIHARATGRLRPLATMFWVTLANDSVRSILEGRGYGVRAPPTPGLRLA